MVLSPIEADTISISPSPSMSEANTECARPIPVSILLAVHEGSEAPLLSNHLIVELDAETISISSSPSISAAKTLKVVNPCPILPVVKKGVAIEAFFVVKLNV